jgi:hypothetical protein
MTIPTVGKPLPSTPEDDFGGLLAGRADRRRARSGPWKSDAWTP